MQNFVQSLVPSHGGGSPSYPPISPPVTSAPYPTQTTTDPDDIIYNDENKPVHEDHDLITDPVISSGGVSKPGQYLVASHPLLGTYTEDVSEFDFLNPFKLPGRIKHEVKDFLQELLTFRR